MRLKPDEIALALQVANDLLDGQGAALVSAESVTVEEKTWDTALILDVASPVLFARLTVAAVRPGASDPPLHAGLVAVAPLAAFVAKREPAGKTATVKITRAEDGFNVRLPDRRQQTFDLVDRAKRDWPRGVRVKGVGNAAHAELMQVLERPVPEGIALGEDVFDVPRALRAVRAVRPAGVTVTHYPGKALVYAGHWFGITFRVVLREGVKGKGKEKTK